MKHLFPRTLATLGCCSVLAGLGGIETPRAHAVRPNARGGRYIVLLKDRAGDAAGEAVRLGRRHGLGLGHVYRRALRGFAASIPPGQVEALAADPAVRLVEPDAVAYAAKRRPGGSSEQLPWGVDRTDANRVWDRFDPRLVVDPGANVGAGVKVAVIDTGIDLDHPDMAANIRGGYNAIDPTRLPEDDQGHGSHVAGIIAAADNSVGGIGVAPAASLYAVKVLNSQSSGWVSDIIEGLDWSVQSGVHVVNMSLSVGSDVAAFREAIVRASAAGVVIVAAAGNYGPGENTVLYPARYPEVIAVAATDSYNNVASFSSRGPEVDVAAPGVSIYSAALYGGYSYRSGTSMAAPHVAGTAALLLASGRIADTNGNGRINDEVQAELQRTADDRGTTGPDTSYGWGLTDAEEAATGLQTN